MNIWMILKTAGDLCLYFSVISSFPGLFIHDFAYLWVVVLGAGGVWMSAVLSSYTNGKWYLLGGLVCLLPLYFASGLIESLVVILPVVYCLAVILRQRMSVHYSEYRAFFLKAAVALGFFFSAICLLAALEEAQIIAENSADAIACLQYGLLFILSSISLLRLLRMGNDSGAGGRTLNRIQTLTVVGGTGLLLVGVAAVERFIRNLDVSSFSEAFINLMAKAFVPIVWLVQMLLGMPESEETREPTMVTDPSFTDTGAAAPPAVQGPGTETPSQVQETGFPWWLVILILALLIVALGIMMRQFSKRQAISDSSEMTEKIESVSRRRKKQSRSNRFRIRQQYREFLRFQRSRGVKIEATHTSLDVQDRISPDTNPAGARQLRQIYLRARYDTEHEVTKEQMEQGRQALKKSIP